VLQADGAMRCDEHRLAFGFEVPVRHGDGRLLVHAGDQLGALVAAIVDDRLVQTAEARTGIGGDILEAECLQHVHHEVGAAPLVVAEDLHLARADRLACGGHDGGRRARWGG
jgi:hypothetical protein